MTLLLSVGVFLFFWILINLPSFIKASISYNEFIFA